MVERIEKIARIKGVDYDVGKRFDSSRQRGDDGNPNFAAGTPPKTSTIPEAYKLELSSIGSEALFYFGATDMRTLLN